ncbi:MAG: rhodanese-like domain-containing protein [Candidatus Eisenbacteria bacterium]|nr:rhodanese-like domain-containing protein [Candidatus Eisenbacteria bacterium]
MMSRCNSLFRLLFRSFLVFALSALVAVAINAGRPDSLRWVADAEYEIFDDCPEGEDTASAVTLDELVENPSYFFVVDSRSPEDYAAGHIEGAFSLPYDPLFSVDDKEIEKILVAAGEKTIVVVGDTLTARLLANDLTSQGLDFVHYLEEDGDWRALLTDGSE